MGLCFSLVPFPATGAGNDELNLVGLEVARLANLNTGGGADEFTVRDSIFYNDFTLLTGGGADTIDFNIDAEATTSLIFVGRTTVNAGKGNDTMNVGGANGLTPVIFGTFTTLNGGPGSNTLVEGANVSANGPFNTPNW